MQENTQVETLLVVKMKDPHFFIGKPCPPWEFTICHGCVGPEAQTLAYHADYDT